MARILISGLINIETTVRVDGFPIDYRPVRYPFFGVNSSVSGVGYNLAKALTTLRHDVRLLALIGRDMAGAQVRTALVEDGITGEFVIEQMARTPQSAILYDESGRRMINTDLKDIQQQVYPPNVFARALRECDLAVLGNTNFTRPYLAAARRAGVLVATDVHTISDLDDEYNRDFMAAADILFMSHERLPCPPQEWMQQLFERYQLAIAVIGLGGDGALLGVRGEAGFDHVPAVATRPVVNTIGAGDALFASFLHGYVRGEDPHAALRKAVVFASYKIGETGAAAGFLDAAELERWVADTRG